MPSPFPGMNPYLEQTEIWHDLHERFVSAVAGLLGPQVPPTYRVALNQQLYLRETCGTDAAVSAGPNRAAGGNGADRPTSPAVSARADRPAAGGRKPPFVGRMPDITVVERLSYIEVRHAATGRAVTYVELLSPRNKAPGTDRDQYLAERRRRVHGGAANLVEIDLLRGGQRPPLQNWPRCDYYALVYRAPERLAVALWPVALRDRLPVIPVPIPDPHPQPLVDLQEALHQTYDEGGFSRFVYRRLPEPPLDPADVAWARHHAPRLF